MWITIKQINYFYLSFVLLWEPLQLAFFKIDKAGRIPFFFAVLVFIINYIYDLGFKKRLLSRPMVFWGMWVFYSAINVLMHQYDKEISFPFFFINFLFTPFLVMLLASREIVRNKKQALQLLSVIFIIYALLSITVLGGKAEADSDRELGELWNKGPLTSLFILFFLGLLYVNGWLSIKKMIPLILFVFVVITMGGTRKAFGGAVLIIVTLIISQFSLSLKKIVLVAFLAGFFYFGYSYIMRNTSMGERFERGMDEGQKFNTTNVKLLNLVGDRAVFYITGWQLFLNNQLTGVGLGNYRRETGSSLVIHSEYMVQLAEGGIIGTLFFLLFNVGIGKGIFNAWKRFPQKRPAIWISIGAFGAILFIDFTGWTYSFTHYFIVYGVIIGSLSSFKDESRKKIKLLMWKKQVSKLYFGAQDKKHNG